MSALEKARIFDPDAPKSGFYVQFNPNTLEYAAGLSGQACKGAADRAGQEGAGVPDLQSAPLAEPQGAVLSVRLFYHTYTSQQFHRCTGGYQPYPRFPAPDNGKGPGQKPQGNLRMGYYDPYRHHGVLQRLLPDVRP